MTFLYQALSARVDEWRTSNYPCHDYPAIREILEFAHQDELFTQLRYLRRAQFRALETYWYLRLILKTPKIPDLYQQLFPKKTDRRTAMGLTHPDIVGAIADTSLDECLQRVLTDNRFVKTYALESLRESLTLDYASYILALAMGAGKTILMGTIVATEFAMAQEYPDGPFVENALIFAPGKTIVESLREIAEIPYDQILPPRMHKTFAASLKLTFTRDGDKNLPITWGSNWNVIVTNTEKIRIQKNTGRKNSQQLALFNNKDEQAREEANLRLQAIASLPHLAIFSDEAHHTYGQKLLGKWETNRESGELEFKEEGIKKIRRTVDYLAQETNLLVVVNTTGTPYFERQPLRDVVVWYGLGEGIRDGVLKELANNIKVFDLDEDDTSTLLDTIITDFVKDYWAVQLPDGSPARMALYFPNTETLNELRPALETALAKQSIDTTTILAVHSKSPEADRRAFYGIAHDPTSPHRIILLVNMGTEGWNCPSLFACGLIRKLTNSNNFVLQAATRCLRQIPGNSHPARVYLTKSNKTTLANQLAETYGTTLADLNTTHAERVEKEIILHKPELPKLLIKKRILRFKRRETDNCIAPLTLTVPDVAMPALAMIEQYTLAESGTGRARLLRTDAGDNAIDIAPPEYSVYGAAVELSANYHLTPAEVLVALRDAYGAAAVPEHHLTVLGEQIERQRSDYEEDWLEVDVAIALVKPEGFTKHIKAGKTTYTARISFAKNREHLYKEATEFANPHFSRALSFHYEGYNFDSAPEAEFLEWVLAQLQQGPHEIDAIWFTGGLTDTNKTELLAEYLGDDGRWHHYTPDFVLLRKDGKHLVVEIKSDECSPEINADLSRLAQNQKPISKEGRKAVALKRWENMNPDILQYHVMYADTLLHDQYKRTVLDFIHNK